MVKEYRGSLKAKQELFNQAGIKAIYEAQIRGIPITYVKDGKIIKEYSDGREEVLGNAPASIPITKKRITLQ